MAFAIKASVSAKRSAHVSDWSFFTLGAIARTVLSGTQLESTLDVNASQSTGEFLVELGIVDVFAQLSSFSGRKTSTDVARPSRQT